MISVFTPPGFVTRFFEGVFPEKIKLVNSYHDADFSLERLPIDYDSNFKEGTVKSIYMLERSNIEERNVLNIRHGYCVDNKTKIPRLSNFCFSVFDFCNIPYMITTAGGPTPVTFISQKPKYWLDYNIKNTYFHNKVYWCGNITTHETRRPFFEFYSSINDSRFDVTEFKVNIYHDKVNPNVFTDHIERLSNADVCFILRGDKPFANSFVEVIMSGCIPIMISSMNYYGWENIFENVDDYMLRFDLREHSMEYIHEQVVLLLEDKERVLHMKANIRNFYNTFFKHSANFGFAEFLVAKCIDIYKNNFDVKRVDSKFICSEILALKGLSGKM